jgi:hypothetical protein
MSSRYRNRRRFRRFNAPAGLQPVRTDVFHRFLDMSIGGMRVISAAAWQPGDLVPLEIQLPVGPPLAVTMEVVWIAKPDLEADGASEVGLRFTDLSDFDRSRIATLLARQARAGL